MTIITSFLSLLLITFWGYLFLNLFKITNIEKLGLSYPVGIGLFTFFLFIFYLIGFRFTFINSLFIFATSSIALVAFNKHFNKIKKENFQIFIIFNSPFEKVLASIVILLILSTILSGFYSPISSWDSISLYDYRSRMFIQTGGFESMKWWSYYFSYPPLTSLAQYWMYLFGADTAMPVHAFFYTFFVLGSFGIFKRYLDNRFSLLFTLFIALAPNLFLHGHLAYTNLPYTIFLVFGTVYIYLFYRTKRLQDIIIGALLIGLSAWARNTEPFWIIPVALVIFYSLKDKKIFPIFIYCLIFFCFQLPWKQYQLFSANISTNSPITVAINTTKQITLSNDYNSIKTVLDYLSWVFFGYYKVFLLIPTLLVFQKIYKKEKTDWFFPVFILLSVLILIGGTYVFSKTVEYWNQIPDSTRRMMLFIPPLSIFYLSTNIKNKLK